MVIVSTPSPYLVVSALVAAVVVEILFGIVLAALALAVAYPVMWKVSSSKARDLPTILSGRASRLVSVKNVPWSEVKEIWTSGTRVVVVLRKKSYGLSFDESQLEGATALIRSRVGARFSSYGREEAVGMKLPINSLLKAMAVVGMALLLLGLGTLLLRAGWIIPVYASAFAMLAGLLTALNSGIAYGLRTKGLLSPLYKALSYCGLLIFNGGLVAMFADALFWSYAGFTYLGFLWISSGAILAFVINKIREQLR